MVGVMSIGLALIGPVNSSVLRTAALWLTESILLGSLIDWIRIGHSTQ